MPAGNMAFKVHEIQERSLFKLEGQLVWCGTMHRSADGLCHLYFSFWDESLGHNAWVTHSKIGYAVAKDPLGPYVFKDIALDGAKTEGAWDRDTVHNPTVIFHNGLLHLYYMGNYGDGSFWSHRNNQRVGHAFAERPEGPWHRSEKPLIDVGSPGTWDCVMTSNPTVCQAPDGRFIMVYKGVGDKNEAPFYGPVLHGVAFAKSPEGPFIKEPVAVFTNGDAKFPCEDPFIFTRNGKLQAILKDMGTNFSSCERGLVLFESKDGLDWRPQNPPLALSRTLPLWNGAERSFHRLERPQLTFIEGKTYLFCAAKPEEKADESFSIAMEVELKN